MIRLGMTEQYLHHLNFASIGQHLGRQRSAA